MSETMVNDVLICYGSETGCAESIAKGIHQEAGGKGWNATLATLNEYKKVDFEKRSLIVIVVSTTGNGEPPRSADRFWRYLKKRSNAENMLEAVSYIVLALGDTNYDKFCHVGKVIDDRMSQLGAKRIKPVACADEGTDLAATVDPFLANLWDTLNKYTIENKAEGTITEVTDAKAHVDISPSENDNKGKKDDVIHVDIIAHQEVTKNVAQEGQQQRQQEEISNGSTTTTNQEVMTNGNEHKGTGSNPVELLVLYGSETGNAEAISKEMHELLTKRGFQSTWATMNEFSDLKLLQTKKHVIFAVSTTGNGDPPRNAEKFWRSVRKRSNAKDMFEGMQYTVLGLGDTNYDQFCKVGKNIDKRMVELGASRFMNLTCCDEAVGLSDSVEPWKKSLLDKLNTMFQPIETEANTPSVPPQVSTMRVASDAVEPKVAAVGVDSPNVAVNVASSSKNSKPATTKSEERVEVDESHLYVKLGYKLPKSMARFEDVCSLGTVEELEAKTGRCANLETCLARVNFVSEEERAQLMMEDDQTVGGTPKNATSVSSIESPQSLVGSSAANPTEAEVFEATYLTSADAEKRVVNIKLRVLPHDFDHGVVPKWQPGDALGIICPNPDALVDGLLSRLRLNGSDYVDVRVRSRGPAGASQSALAQERALFPNLKTVNSIRSIFTWGVDVTSIPRKSFLRLLAEHCTNQMDRHRLLYLSSITGKETFIKLIEQQKPSLLEILQMFPSCCPPLDSLLYSLPKLSPRFYSIANSPLGPGGHAKISLAFTVVETKLGENRFVNGVCTSYLEHLGEPWLVHNTEPRRLPKLRVFVRNSSGFHLPGNVEIPVIMIGPGTGVTPFIGFLEHRKYLKDMQKNLHGDLYEGFWRSSIYIQASDFNNLEKEPVDLPEADFAEMWLYYGCRRKNEDFLFKEFLSQAAESKQVMSTFRVAFSREQEQKIYVQHLLNEDAKQVVDCVLNKNGYIYVCGDGVSMAKQVHQTLQQAFVTHGRMNMLQAQRFMQTLAAKGRYSRDIW